MAAVTAGTEADREQAQRRDAGTEVYPLLLFALGGMMLFVSANDLLTMFVALEVFSLPLYLMCGLARRRRLLSQEAALKYFLLGAFASAFFLFGIAMLYGFAGQVTFSGIHAAIQESANSQLLLYSGLALISILGAAVVEAGSIGILFALLNLPSAMIVFGGTIGALIVSFPLDRITQLTKVLGVAFRDEHPDGVRPDVDDADAHQRRRFLPANPGWPGVGDARPSTSSTHGPGQSSGSMRSRTIAPMGFPSARSCA